MLTVDDILSEVRRFSAEDRRRLVDEIEALQAADQPDKDLPIAHSASGSAPEPEDAEQPRPAPEPYAALVALAGSAHSDYTDVSTNKYKHLAEIYADQHDE